MIKPAFLAKLPSTPSGGVGAGKFSSNGFHGVTSAKLQGVRALNGEFVTRPQQQNPLQRQKF